MDDGTQDAVAVLKQVREALKCKENENIIERAKAMVHTDDLIVATMRITNTENNTKIATFVSGEATRLEFEISQSRLNYKIIEVFKYMDIEAQAKKIIAPGGKGGIITPK